MPAYTLLAIDGIDFSQYAVRGITMTLEPIDQAASLARDCRGASGRHFGGTVPAIQDQS